MHVWAAASVDDSTPPGTNNLNVLSCDGSSVIVVEVASYATTKCGRNCGATIHNEDRDRTWFEEAYELILNAWTEPSFQGGRPTSAAENGS
jgi:hypothetical protein